VLVKVAACSLNYRDLAVVSGTYRMPMKPNVVRCRMAPGEIVEIGAEITRFKVGDKLRAISRSAGRAARRQPIAALTRWAVALTACLLSMSCWRKAAP